MPEDEAAALRAAVPPLNGGGKGPVETPALGRCDQGQHGEAGQGVDEGGAHLMQLQEIGSLPLSL